MTSLGESHFSIIDADSHVYEPERLWDDYVPEAYAALARSAFFHSVDDEGNALTILNGEAAQELNRSKLVRQAIGDPA